VVRPSTSTVRSATRAVPVVGLLAFALAACLPGGSAPLARFVISEPKPITVVLDDINPVVLSLTISNLGVGPGSVNVRAEDKGNVDIDNCDGQVPAGGSCELVVTFPTDTSTESLTLWVDAGIGTTRDGVTITVEPAP
jgi:hypothetical protein